MTASGSNPLPSLGFLTVCRHDEYGLFGGYLLLNAAGRPLEFHCTAPVKPNRAQQILYGPTLEPYLYGEQIGQTLVARSKLQPLIVLTDRQPVLALRGVSEMPVALVVSESEKASSATGAEPIPHGLPTSPSQVPGNHLRIDGPHETPPPSGRLLRFHVGRHALCVDTGHAEDEANIRHCCGGLLDQLDLHEPFGRIREAIEEAQRSAR